MSSSEYEEMEESGPATVECLPEQLDLEAEPTKDAPDNGNETKGRLPLSA